MTRRKVRIEQRVEVRCSPQRIFEVLSDPGQVSQFATGIEGAQVIENGPDGGLVGAKIEMVTRNGNTLMAKMVELDPPHKVVWEDERGVRSTWTVEGKGDGCLLENLIEGDMSDQSARALAYDADLKFQALARSFETPGDDVAKGEGHSAISGTPETPKKQ